MKILVTGGTGFIGRFLVERLVEKGEDVTCFAREGSNLDILKKLKVKIVLGNIFDIESLKDAVMDKDIIYHLIAEGNLSANSEEDFQKFFKVNAEGTKNILEAVKRYGKKDIKKIVCFSSTAAVGLKNTPVDENTVPDPVSPYQRSKFESEKIAKGYFEKFGLPVCIVRPSMVFGPYAVKSEILRICRFVKKGVFILFNNGKNAVPLAYVDDVVDGTLIIGEKGKPGETYFVTWDKVFTMRELVDSVSKAMGKKPFVIRIPKIISFPLTFIMEKAAIVLGFRPLVTIERINSMTSNRVFIVDKLKGLGFKPEDDLDKAIMKTVEWYKGEGLV